MSTFFDCKWSWMIKYRSSKTIQGRCWYVFSKWSKAIYQTDTVWNRQENRYILSQCIHKSFKNTSTHQANLRLGIRMSLVETSKVFCCKGYPCSFSMTLMRAQESDYRSKRDNCQFHFEFHSRQQSTWLITWMAISGRFDEDLAMRWKPRLTLCAT